ncbi:MAG: MgtC/SapB family protein [Nanoarchaeota archaeon]|nr:MgtC/SapB family protein [Nanoarchaeota archaeon]MBU1030797.1 MgtC/SapB family protein [Nanoarchaeota archaeon]MBU1850374.1 MgtC/SapB family protein [Nanoarchaeota archaeon]
MADFTIFLRFLLALLLGALIGAERERFAKLRDEYLFGGIRTFMFISLLGALSAYIAEMYFSWFIAFSFSAVLILIAISYFAATKFSKGASIGLTAEITGLLVFIIGLITFKGELIFAVVLAIIITTVLYMRDTLHKLIKKVSREEMYGTLIFAIIAFVILPFLPNQTYGPLDVFNPYKIWLMVVFISGLGYVGYILIKLLGSKKGLGLTGFLGGLVSSTAVTMSFATSSKTEKNAKTVRLFVFATLIANAVMFVRVIIEVYVVNRMILGKLLIPLGVMFIVALAGAFYMWLSSKNSTTITNKAQKIEVTHTSPLSLGPALKFGLLFGVVLFVIKFAQIYFGNKGIFLASLVSGFVDVDAITLSMASLAGTEISAKVAATAITIAVMSNTVIKFIYAAIFGSKSFRKSLGVVFALMMVAGIVSILLI